jgi:hypothetical protein
MTPQERQLVADLFERLAQLENQPRDRDAEQAIQEGLAKAPHAIYALVQSALVQDEALKRADAHIRELEAALQGEAPEQPRGFLDSMRDNLFGSEPSRGSVPSVRPGDQPMGVPPQYRSASGAQWGSGATQAPMAQVPMPQQASGGFLGTAAATAAGMIGGGLLLDGIRGMLGGGAHRGPFAGAFDNIAASGSRSPWSGAQAGGAQESDLARQAGIDDIGRGQGRAGLFDAGDNQGDDRTGLTDTADDDADLDDSDFDDDAGSDDTDYA